MGKSHVLAGMAVAMAAGLSLGQEEPKGASACPTALEQLRIIEALAPSLVRVELWLQHDKGESPSYAGRYRRTEPEEAIEDERPYEVPGYLVADDTVICPDHRIHERFIKSMSVRFGQEAVDASIAGLGVNQDALILKLSKPLKGAKPLKFDSTRQGPYMALTHERTGAFWGTRLESLSETVAVTDGGHKIIPCPQACLIVDRAGVPVAMSMVSEMPADGSWKAPPSDWAIVDASEMDKKLQDLAKLSGRCLLRVQLGFRSPRKKADSSSYRVGDDDPQSTQQNVPGVLIADRQVLVLANLKPKITARLESITVHAADGRRASAVFDGSLQDYGAFMAKLDEPLEGAAALSGKAITDYDEKIVVAADLRLQGETRTEYFGRGRVKGFDLGWRQQIYPGIASSVGAGFVFDMDGRLTALAIVKRPKAGEDDRGWSSRPKMTAAAYLKETLTNLAANIDASNVPLTEQEENRLAWLGVELQPLDRELARINKVSDLTSDGDTGALVSYVYPDSPAGKAGLRVGDVLLRVYPQGYPSPLDVKVERYGFSERPFPWEHLDRMPEQYFDCMPTPWPPAENSFTRALTDIGFGKNFEVEFFRDGKTCRQPFVVEQSPPYFDTAEQYKSKAIGLTVANLTYEARRYFQRRQEEPGVIVPKLEPGSKAAVAGIRPYEIITHVNDQPVTNVQDFARAVEGQARLRLAVKRMTTGRVVSIKLDAAGGPSSQPAEPSTAPAGQE